MRAERTIGLPINFTSGRLFSLSRKLLQKFYQNLQKYMKKGRQKGRAKRALLLMRPFSHIFVIFGRIAKVCDAKRKQRKKEAPTRPEQNGTRRMFLLRSMIIKQRREFAFARASTHSAASAKQAAHRLLFCTKRVSNQELQKKKA